MSQSISSFTYFTVFLVGVLAIAGDVTLTWTSPVIGKLYSNDTNTNPLSTGPINEDIESWIGSLINIGAMIGPIPYGFISEKFGRKIALLCIALPHIASYLTLAFAKSYYLYYFARLLSGIALGGSYTILPMYVAEISQDSNRGQLSVMLNIFWTFGNLLPYIVGPYISIMWFNIGLTCLPICFLVVFCLLAPETPYYLVSVHKHKEAENSLRKFRQKENVDKEIIQIESIIAHDEKSHWIDLFRKKSYLKALGISLFLIISQQLTGIDAILFYTEEIFASASITKIPTSIDSIIIGLVLFGSSFITPFIVDLLGRKLLLMVSGFGMSVALSTLGVYFYLQQSTDFDVSKVYWVPIASLVLFIVMYNLGMGPLPWTITAELFPANVKSMAASMVSFSCWFTSFLVTKFYTQLNELIGIGETYWLFASFALLAIVFTIMFVPETKGKSFQEIQEVLSR